MNTTNATNCAAAGAAGAAAVGDDTDVDAHWLVRRSEGDEGDAADDTRNCWIVEIMRKRCDVQSLSCLVPC